MFKSVKNKNDALGQRETECEALRKTIQENQQLLEQKDRAAHT